MEYKISNRLKIAAIVMIVLGLIGVTYGFMDSHSYTKDNIAERLEAEKTGHGNHGDVTHAKKPQDESHKTSKSHTEEAHEKVAHTKDHSPQAKALHQIHNRPWAALYVGAFFFFMIALGVLAFYAIQYAAQAGWSPVLFRVMEGITAYVLPGAIIVLLIAVASHYLGHNSIFIWMDENMSNPESDVYDKLVAGKSGYLNLTWFIIRGVIFIAGWALYRHYSRKFSIAQDHANDNRNFKKNFKISAAFLVFYIYTESIMSWDWIMSVDPHWFSTLFGWYVFASMFVSGITAIAMITIYLKSRGYLEFVNDSHIHDLAKFMFAISIFWTYLWFSQFMLIWYANIPEEATYYISRIFTNDFRLPFFAMLAMNFIFPFLILMNSDYKRIPWFVVMAGIIILCGHYLDVYNMIIF